MSITSTWLLFVVPAIASAALIFIILRSPIARHVVDQPGRLNSMHTQPIPRIGGAALMAVVATAAIFSGLPTALLALLGAALALTAISIIDDVIGLSASLRFTAHLIAASVITVFFLVPPEYSISPFTSLLSIAATILLITWITNLFNFMDGADGLAGGMAVLGFGAYALAAASVASTPAAMPIATLSTIISGAALGFLAFNFSPAKVFMGDAGSIPLGFLAATLGLYGISTNIWPWWLPLLVFSPFIVDATMTLLKRITRGEKIWVAHRQHYYHRLILSGWNHRRVALSYYLLMMACAASALAARKDSFPAPMLACWVVIYGLLMMILERRFKLKAS